MRSTFGVAVVLAVTVTLGLRAMPQATRSGAVVVRGNVVDAMTGLGIPDASVSLIASSPASSNSERTLPRRATAMTARDGSFLFSDVESGRYAIDVSRSGFAIAKGVPSSSQVSVGVAGDVKDIELYMTALSTISGRVVNESGEPVSDVSVVALQPYYEGNQRYLNPTFRPRTRVGGTHALTDERGEYRLYDLESGDFYLAVWGAGLDAGVDGPPIYYPGITDATRASVVRVGAGVELPAVDIRLIDRPFYRVTFEVLGLNEAVSCVFRQEQMWLIQRSSDFDVLLSYSTGLFDHGAFRQVGENRWSTSLLPNGSYDIFFSPCMGQGVTGRAEFSIVDEDVETEVELREGSPLQARFSLATGSSLDLSGAEVRLDSVEWPRYTPPAVMIWSDGRGCFVVRRPIPPRNCFALADGQYTVDVAGLPANAFVHSIRYAGRDVVNGIIAIDGGAAGELEIVVGGPGGVIEGRVTDSSNEVVSGARVVLTPVSNRLWSNSTLFRNVRTDQGGAFSIAGIGPGEYVVLAFEYLEDGSWRDPGFLDRYGAAGERITIGSMSRETVRLGLVDVTP